MNNRDGVVDNHMNAAGHENRDEEIHKPKKVNRRVGHLKRYNPYLQANETPTKNSHHSYAGNRPKKFPRS